MSTRATIHWKESKEGKAVAITYRHSDGYPEGLGKDIKDFLNEIDKLPDNRFNDPSYLAARWIVYDSVFKRDTNDLGFTGVGIVNEDPGDIEYRYEVICENRNKPEVTINHV